MSSTDRELLESAAKAAGVELFYRSIGGAVYTERRGLACASGKRRWWNPLIDDGDAFRLSVKLDMRVCVGRVDFGDFETWEDSIDMPEADVRADPTAATRRAIVRAAAAMVERPVLGAA
jgi:hypothetical protein